MTTLRLFFDTLQMGHQDTEQLVGNLGSNWVILEMGLQFFVHGNFNLFRHRNPAPVDGLPSQVGRHIPEDVLEQPQLMPPGAAQLRWFFFGGFAWKLGISHGNSQAFLGDCRAFHEFLTNGLILVGGFCVKKLPSLETRGSQ